jgi:hypothetical protein
VESKGKAIIDKIIEIIHSEEFKDQSRVSEKDFTRNRKVGFVDLVCMLLRTIRRTTQLELDEFREFFMQESIGTTYTKQSFSEARQKLLPEAFLLLNEALIQEYYADQHFLTYKGFRLLAIDGSVLEIPNTKENRETYGYISNQQEDFQVARSLSSHLFDVENKLMISSCMSRYKDSERNVAKQNIEKLLSLEQTEIQNLVLFDRGYPSADLLLYLKEKGIRYMMRCSTSFYKEIYETTSSDEMVKIEIDRKRASDLKRQGTPIPKGTILDVRVIKVELSTGETEILLTDTTPEEVNYEESKALYFKRWGVETQFDELKNKWEVENFSGEKPLLLEQDFYATLLVSNIASLVEQEAEAELKKKSEIKNESMRSTTSTKIS